MVDGQFLLRAGKQNIVQTGIGSLQLSRYRPNATILSAALATPNGSTNGNVACAVAVTRGTCTNGLTSSSTITLAGGTTIAIAAGDKV